MSSSGFVRNYSWICCVNAYVSHTVNRMTIDQRALKIIWLKFSPNRIDSLDRRVPSLKAALGSIASTFLLSSFFCASLPKRPPSASMSLAAKNEASSSLVPPSFFSVSAFYVSR